MEVGSRILLLGLAKQGWSSRLIQRLMLREDPSFDGRTAADSFGNSLAQGWEQRLPIDLAGIYVNINDFRLVSHPAAGEYQRRRYLGIDPALPRYTRARA